MKLKFDSNLDYQNEAVNSVIDLFKGQNSMFQYFTVVGQSGLTDSGQGVGNKIDISKEDILENLRKIQSYYKLAPSESLNGLDFNIEMETGTGKTYVYLKTIFELNKEYGFTKFIIVVPSVAIKEGVNKTIEITKEHFKSIYDNVPYDYFVYDSSKLEQVRNFAVNSTIQIMIINIDAFNKSFSNPSKETKANIIHREQDKLSGYKPIDLIAETNPIVIIDEPQSVVGTKKSDAAIASLNPLCTLRYSATHKEIQNLIYKLDAIDASEKELVKQIEVAGFVSSGYHNEAYLKLISVNNLKSPITAKIEIDANVKGSVKRKTVTVKQGSDLSEVRLGNRDIYNGYIVDEIYCEKGNEYVTFTQKDEILRIGKVFGDVDDLTLKRAQIRKTIEEHLDKELSFAKTKNPIKVLSLFFIDKVANYRQYDSEGNPTKGKYAKIFEEEYKKIIKKPKYSTLYDYIDLDLEAEDVHNGYFSVDKKGKVKDTKETKAGKLRSNKDDESTFNLIMRDKEKLLSFDSKLKFIFSHSALREGWDNPNVFQICTLNETTSTMKKRQEIGRGLRLCVNQDGERIHDKNINVLTVMANESYEDFARNLQKEIEDETGIKFGTIQKTDFAHIEWTNKKGKREPLGKQHSLALFNHFKLKKYINASGKIQDALKVAVMDGTVDVPQDYIEIKNEIVEVIEKPTKKLPIKNANNRRKVKVNKHIYLSEDFKEFWDSIKHKTTYAVEFDTDELVSKCIQAMQENLNVKAPKLIYTKSGLTIEASGVNPNDDGTVSTVYSNEDEIALPDIVTYLQNETDLTRRTIVRILIESETIDQFKKNPQEYMQETSKLINKVMAHLIIDGIKYTKIDDYYSQELFKNEELFGYLERNMVESENSVYDHIIYDSEVEKNFALRLDKDPEVKLYTKLPTWFKIKTPLGNYNPDWAVMIDKDGENKLYFVVETKGTTEYLGIKASEQAKIDCGRKHFKALGDDIHFDVADNYENFKTKIVN
ncbi:type III restriction enzyme, res subunit [Methanobrevibacter oralis]|uniref:Type III restriction enzyme, res subunit n=2 Tax=Methanobrevibacter oralis TaxID=66851 RepID=A0A166C874_METOA|nr:DEAD/DEAH box helicase family protein [Methanobrevibacter oralis]KZX12117.1 type III restriction enzyme, res subunit [Methanobrevibacter oralis]